MNGYKLILLAEDSQPDVELTIEALREQNVANEVAVVRDGEEVLDFMYHRGAYADRPAGLPLVVLLDLKMPKLDGLDVLRTLRADPEMRTVPIVMLTSSREEADLTRSYELGANAYVVKPVDFEQFFAAVKQIGMFWAVINEPPPDASNEPAR
jgi:two-component system, response regulator